ncbi:hypothetical protein ACFWVF_31700 [Streptomyces sp. NPDC058659]|uniref:hypothetical protein n=1 Tax=unclassified Streptomyces TaxID=2593676 RepID=UPI003652A963
MIDDVARWHGFAALLPPAEAREFRDCWDIGEQEAGLGLLVAALLEHRVPIGGTTRAEIAVTAEEWGVREAVEPGLGRLPYAEGGRRGDDALRLVDPADGLPLPGPAGSAGSAGPSGPSDGAGALLVVPWIVCTRCGRTLARAHEREPWGDLSYLARHYALFAPGRSAPERSFADGAAWEALTALRVSCGGGGGGGR